MKCDKCKYHDICFKYFHKAMNDKCKRFESIDKRLESIAKSHLDNVFEYDKNQLPIV